jgi:hypothetical protein
MTFINTKELGLYAPKTNEKVKLAQEAQKYIPKRSSPINNSFTGCDWWLGAAVTSGQPFMKP